MQNRAEIRGAAAFVALACGVAQQLAQWAFTAHFSGKPVSRIGGFRDAHLVHRTLECTAAICRSADHHLAVERGHGDRHGGYLLAIQINNQLVGSGHREEMPATRCQRRFNPCRSFAIADARINPGRIQPDLNTARLTRKQHGLLRRRAIHPRREGKAAARRKRVGRRGRN